VIARRAMPRKPRRQPRPLPKKPRKSRSRSPSRKPRPLPKPSTKKKPRAPRKPKPLGARSDDIPSPSTTAADPAAWHAWLAANHATHDAVYLVFWKTGTGTASITWAESVVEALCYGWIDGQRKPIDADRYWIRFTPRRRGSNWSAVNVATAERLIAEGKMTAAGLAAIDEAKASGAWAKPTSTRDDVPMPAELAAALAADAAAKARFDALAPSYQRQNRRFVAQAVAAETRERRVQYILSQLAETRRKRADR
jgi:uncharacterized protein YdeI (YjbR/CyaY-like superfamily)